MYIYIVQINLCYLKSYIVVGSFFSLGIFDWLIFLFIKVLIGWFAYVQQRKHKKQRIADAMERRRCRLLKEGVTQWLLVADDLRAMRMKFAAQQQAKVIV